jgi:adenine-specific DNA-methyltransferase
VELALDLVDGKLLIDMLGIEAEICQQCRSIWKKLQRRRLERNGDKQKKLTGMAL